MDTLSGEGLLKEVIEGRFIEKGEEEGEEQECLTVCKKVEHTLLWKGKQVIEQYGAAGLLKLP